MQAHWTSLCQAYSLTKLACGLALTLALGCSQKQPWEVTQPVVGSVEYKGKPVGNAELSFFPVDPKTPESVRPRAKSTPDGKFTAWTYVEGDGMPAGKYKVTVVRNEVAVSKDTLVAKPNDLPAKYSRLDTTDLEIEVKPGDNQLPSIVLK